MRKIVQYGLSHNNGVLFKKTSSFFVDATLINHDSLNLFLSAKKTI